MKLDSKVSVGIIITYCIFLIWNLVLYQCDNTALAEKIEELDKEISTLTAQINSKDFQSGPAEAYDRPDISEKLNNLNGSPNVDPLNSQVANAIASGSVHSPSDPTVFDYVPNGVLRNNDYQYNNLRINPNPPSA